MKMKNIKKYIHKKKLIYAAWYCIIYSYMIQFKGWLCGL